MLAAPSIKHAMRFRADARAFGEKGKGLYERGRSESEWRGVGIYFFTLSFRIVSNAKYILFKSYDRYDKAFSSISNGTP